MDFTFDRGDRVRDKVTRFEGIVISRADHISGCNTYGVQPVDLKDGAPQDVRWFDEPRLEGTGKRVRLVVDTRRIRTGADSVPKPTH